MRKSVPGWWQRGGRGQVNLPPGGSEEKKKRKKEERRKERKKGQVEKRKDLHVLTWWVGGL